MDSSWGSESDGHEAGTVLVVSGDPQAVTAICRALSRDGYAVAVGTSGKDARRHLEKSVPDLIVLDLRRLGTDESRFLEQCSGDRRLLDVPLVVVGPASGDYPGDVTPFRNQAVSVDATALLQLIRRLTGRGRDRRLN